jgi:hypothetical protein
MAQKFITKRNRHLFRKPVKPIVGERFVVELTPAKEEVIPVEEVVVNAVVEVENIEPKVVDAIEEPKKRKTKKSKEVVTEETEE